MTQRSRTTFQKLEKERARQQKRKEKAARRLDAKQKKASQCAKPTDEDPDIAGIKPGPQPLPEQWDDVKQEE